MVFFNKDKKFWLSPSNLCKMMLFMFLQRMNTKMPIHSEWQCSKIMMNQAENDNNLMSLSSAIDPY